MAGRHAPHLSIQTYLASSAHANLASWRPKCSALTKRLPQAHLNVSSGRSSHAWRMSSATMASASGSTGAGEDEDVSSPASDSYGVALTRPADHEAQQDRPIASRPLGRSARLRPGDSQLRDELGLVEEVQSRLVGVERERERAHDSCGAAVPGGSRGGDADAWSAGASCVAAQP
jgi:hypothetical protein